MTARHQRPPDLQLRLARRRPIDQVDLEPVPRPRYDLRRQGWWLIRPSSKKPLHLTRQLLRIKISHHRQRRGPWPQVSFVETHQILAGDCFDTLGCTRHRASISTVAVDLPHEKVVGQLRGQRPPVQQIRRELLAHPLHLRMRKRRVEPTIGQDFERFRQLFRQRHDFRRSRVPAGIGHQAPTQKFHLARDRRRVPPGRAPGDQLSLEGGQTPQLRGIVLGPGQRDHFQTNQREFRHAACVDRKPIRQVGVFEGRKTESLAGRRMRRRTTIDRHFASGITVSTAIWSGVSQRAAARRRSSAVKSR